MSASDVLNGYWEEGYHYYLEFQDDFLIVRQYDRKIVLETEVSCEEKDNQIEIRLKDKILSYTFDHQMMSEIRRLRYEDGVLKLLYHSAINGDKEYTLKKTDHSPFSHIIIRDEEYINSLQGKWYRWNGNGDYLEIRGNKVYWMNMEEDFRVVSYVSTPDKVQLVPADLCQGNFRGFTSIDVKEDMLTCFMIVYDMSVPLSVFARKEMLDKINVPERAKRKPSDTMTSDHRPLNPFIEEKEENKEVFRCPECGMEYKNEIPKFCAECGRKLKE